MIAIGSDHAGFPLKETIKNWLLENNIEFTDFGTNSNDSCDYPDFAHGVAGSIIDGENVGGILICGTGNGISMTANKWRGIRCALCWTPEIAKLSRLHNNANVLSMPARFINESEAIEIVKTFFETEFEGGRHENRVNKINPF
jgi:ribose 5-phosphate isomerase B